MVAYAEEMLAAARPWWAVGRDGARRQLADPLSKLSALVAFHKKHDRTSRPMHRMGQTALMWACHRAADEIRLNVRPDDQGAEALWNAWAREPCVVLDVWCYRGYMTTPRRIRLTGPTMAVVDALTASTTDDPVWGLRICETADLGTGTVYPILERLAEAGWIESWHEAGQPTGRPRRRYYMLTNAGRAGYAEALQTKANRRRRWTFQPSPTGGMPT